MKLKYQIEAVTEKLMNILMVNVQHPLCQKLSEAIGIFREDLEKHKLKLDNEALIKNVKDFISMKNLASLNKRIIVKTNRILAMPLIHFFNLKRMHQVQPDIYLR